MKKLINLRVVNDGETIKKLMGYLENGYRIVEVRACDGGVCNVLEKEDKKKAVKAGKN